MRLSSKDYCLITFLYLVSYALSCTRDWQRCLIMVCYAWNGSTWRQN